MRLPIAGDGGPHLNGKTSWSSERVIIENSAPLFWNTVLGGLQAAAFVAMGRVRSEIGAQRRPAAEACAGQPADILKGRARPAKAGDGERTAK